MRDKGYGMGSWIGRITSPITGREESTPDVGYVFDAEPENLSRWRVWWRRTNTEHTVSFLFLCLVSIALLSLIAHALLETGKTDEAATLAARIAGFSRDPRVLVDAGLLLESQDETRAAEAAFRDACEAQPLANYYLARPPISTAPVP